MIFYMSLLFITKTCLATVNVGSTLFHNRDSECWSEDDLAKLKARRIFETLVPFEVTPDIVNTKYVKDTIKFFKRALRMVDKTTDHHTATILREALADTIGAHLRAEILPTARFAYYAGYVPYRNVRQLHSFLDELKVYLNTQGEGWKRPLKVPQWSNMTVVKILVGSETIFDPCRSLVMKRDANSCIHLPPPKLDDDREPSAIALPLKNGGLVSLIAPNSENILLKYYTTASRCILKKSPSTCRHSDFVNFNNELWHWMKRDVAPHLLDEKLYAAYGGILRIAAAVQNYGKGLSRRNLYDSDDDSVTKWQPWRALTQNGVYVNTDWSPCVYVGYVCLIAIGICMLQICYNYMFGDRGCQCRGYSKKTSISSQATLDRKYQGPSPRKSTLYYNDVIKPSISQFRANSISHCTRSSVKTQKVYDLNENTEKMMAVIMSNNDSNDDYQSHSKEESEIEDHIVDVGQRDQSPPKIDTPISQLRIDRRSRSDSRATRPVYSTSTTRTELTCRHRQQPVTDSAWSGTASSTSIQSVSSISSKSRRTRSTRSLNWARRVVSKHSTHAHTNTSGTELDLNSFTTPPSRRSRR